MKELTEIEIFLNSVIGLKRNVDSNMAEIKAAQNEVSSLKGIRYDLPRVSGGRNSDLCDEIIAKESTIEKKTRDLIIDVDRLNKRREKLHRLIDLLSQPEMKSIMQYKYVLGYSWDEVGAALHYTGRNARYIHKRAIDEWNNEHGEAVQRILSSS